MLIRSVFLGLVLASLVLALPTKIEKNDQVTENSESRRELFNKKDEERRTIDKAEEERKNIRRGVDENKENRRAALEREEEEKEQRRRELNNKENEEKKEERRRGVDKEEEKKEQRRRELEAREQEKENRRRGTETFEEERKKEERRETEEKKNERRGVDKKENEEKKEERRRELNKKEEEKKEQRRRELEAREEEKENRRRGTETFEEERKKEERRESNKKEEEEKEERRRGVDKEEKKKEERRRELNKKENEEKKEERRGVDKKEEEEKEERRRELESREEKKENRRRGTETFEEERKKEERRETEKKNERRGVDKKEEEEKKEERRRELNKEEEKKENRRRGVDKENEEKKEERRELNKKEEEEKEERRRGVDKEEEKKEQRRRELNKKENEEKKEERRRELEAREQEKENRRRGTESLKEERKKEERRESNKKEEEEKEERRRELNKKENEEKKEERRETMQSEREKRRPTPAIKEERRETGNIDREEEKKEERRELNNRKLPISKREVAKESSLSICESVTDFKYYQKYESDPSKYIQCDPWGTGKIKSCEEGLFWNEWTLKCDAKEHIHNMTLDLSKFSVTTAQRPVINCSLVGMECLNGGSCVQSVSGLYKCACRSDYTGQYCENRVDLTDVTHEILNSTFSVVEYRNRLREENITLGIHYYEKYRDQLDNTTYTELINYLKLYPNGEVRYDTLVNSVVEDILENIYPDAGYLSVFNASEQSVVTMVQMVPSLLSYSRYSFERYEDVFAQYQHVLTTLAKLLNSSIPTIQKEATQYTVLTHIFLNQTLALLNNTVDKSLFTENSSVEQPIQLTEADIKKALQVNYNATLKATEQLLQILEVFQTSVVKELETNPGKVVNATLGEAKFAGAQEMLAVLNQVSVASAQIWESLINYGFWYLTNLFSSSSKVDSLQRFSFNLNKF